MNASPFLGNLHEFWFAMHFFGAWLALGLNLLAVAIRIHQPSLPKETSLSIELGAERDGLLGAVLLACGQLFLAVAVTLGVSMVRVIHVDPLIQIMYTLGSFWLAALSLLMARRWWHRSQPLTQRQSERSSHV